MTDRKKSRVPRLYKPGDVLSNAGETHTIFETHFNFKENLKNIIERLDKKIPF